MSKPPHVLLAIGQPPARAGGKRESLMGRVETVSTFIRYCTYTAVFGLLLLQAVFPARR